MRENFTVYFISVLPIEKIHTIIFNRHTLKDIGLSHKITKLVKYRDA